MNTLFLLKDDEFTCRFLQIDVDDLLKGLSPFPIDFTAVEFSRDGKDRNVFTAAAVIQEGERQQRGCVTRKMKKRTRNISSRPCLPARCLGWTRNPAGMVSADRKAGKKMHKEFQQQLGEVVAAVLDQAKWKAEGPSRWSYVINGDVLDAAETVGCTDYFTALVGQRFFAADLVRIEVAVKEMTSGGDEVMKALRRTKTDEHLSMISLSADEQGGLYLTIVDPEGHYLKVEASRFVEMIDSFDQARRLHVFPPRGSREPVPFAFNGNNKGEIIGRFLPGEMKLDVVCCQGQGQYNNIHDRSFFFLDPEYILCLWLVLDRLEKDRIRYEKLKQFAEARVEFNPFAVCASF